MITRRLWALLLTFSLLWLAACGSNSSSPVAGDGPANPTDSTSPSNGAFPNIWELDELSRRASVFSGGEPVVVPGDAFMMEWNGTADSEAHTLMLTGDGSGPDGDMPLAWGLYQVSGLNDNHAPQTLNTQAVPQGLGDSFYIGLANFSNGSWEWYGPVSIPEYEVDLTGENSRYVSELGNMYFIIVAENSVVQHNQTTLLFGESNDGLPGAPKELSATKGTYSDRVNLHWNGGQGATYFEIWRRTDGSNHEFELIGESEVREYPDVEVDTGVHYIYKVRACNSAGCSAFSSTDWGYSGEHAGNADCPGELWASDGLYDAKVRLEWQGNPERSYEVWRRPAEGQHDFTYLANANHNNYNDATAEPGVVYKYKVALEFEGGMCWSNVDSGYRSMHQNDPCPTELGASQGTHTEKVILEWNGVPGSHYVIFRKVAETETEFDDIGFANDLTKFYDMTAEPGVVYAYKVALFVEEQAQCWSNIATGWRGEGGGGDECPSELGASKGTHAEKVIVEWNGHTGSMYGVYRRVAESENEFAFLGSTNNGTIWYDNTAEPGVVYEYKVALLVEEQPHCWSNSDTGWLAEETGDGDCPTELSVSKGAFPNAIKLHWQGNADKGYDIWRKVDGGGEWEFRHYSPEGLQWFDEDVEPGVTYLYKVGREQPDEGMCWSNIDHGYTGENEE